MSLKEYERPAPPQVDPGPSQEELARQREMSLQEDKRQAELEAARAQAKAEAMERFVREAYAHGRSQPQQNPEAQQAAQSLGLTEEIILEDPTRAIAMIAEEMRRKDEAFREYQSRVNGVVGNLAKSNFKAEMQALHGERFAEWLVPYVEDYFRRNPEEAFQEGRVRGVYNELVGSNYEELERLHREKTAVPGQRERVVETPIRTTYPAQEAKKADSHGLPEEEAFFLEEMNKRMGQYAMTPEEWADIRSGRKYPKKIATDIQVRGAKPNVSY